MQALDCRSAEKRNAQELSFFQYVQIKYAIFFLTYRMHKLYGALWLRLTHPTHLTFIAIARWEKNIPNPQFLQ